MLRCIPILDLNAIHNRNTSKHFFKNIPLKAGRRPVNLNDANCRNLCGTLFQFFLLVVFLTGFGTASTAQAWQVTLNWDANDPAPDGYRVYMRQEGEAFDFSTPKWEGATTNCTIAENSGQADYYFVVRAFVEDDESGDSNEVKYTPATTDDTPDADTDTDQTVDPDLDSDNDGVTDVDETYVYFTDPTNADSDGDGYSDGQEATLGTDPNDAESIPDTTSQPVNIWIEAEDGDIFSPMTIEDNDQASSELCVWTPTGSGIYKALSGNAGRVVYSFNLPEDGVYVVWGRVIANDSASDSFFVSVDDQADMVWHTIQGGQNTWTWDVISERVATDAFDTTNPTVYELSAGTHTITFTQRESETMLDRILITNDLNYVPEGKGQTDTDSEDDYSDDGQTTSDTDSDDDYTDDGQITSGTDSDDDYSDDGQITPDTDSDDTVSDDQQDSIWIEAEDGDIYSPMVISDNAQASNASFIEVPESNKNYWQLSSEAGRAIYTFDVPEAGSYVIWTRIIANDKRSNSIFVSVDGEPHMVWNTMQSEIDTWTWDVITKRRFWKTYDTDNPEVYQLDAGTHTIEFVQRESGMMIDGILITKDLTWIPGS